MSNNPHFKDMQNITDISDIHSIIDKEDRKTKERFFGFHFFSITIKNATFLFFFQISHIKIASNLLDFLAKKYLSQESRIEN